MTEFGSFVMNYVVLLLYCILFTVFDRYFVCFVDYEAGQS